MTENDLRGIVVAQARGWVGRKESDGSHREIIDIYNTIQPLPRGYRMTYNDPWCAAFVSAVAQATHMTEWIFPECACDPMIALYKAAGRWVEDDSYRPKPGDVIFYDWQDNGYGDNMGSSDHVGLVIDCSGNIINIIEGNCSDRVMYTSRAVNGQYIRGFGIPDYAAAADEAEVIIDDQPSKPVEPDEDNPKTDPEDGYSVNGLPLLKEGDEFGYVYTAQTLLIAHGYDCGGKKRSGVEIADGEFGPATKVAVGMFQSRNRLPVTGEIRGEEWAALLKF